MVFSATCNDDMGRQGDQNRERNSQSSWVSGRCCGHGPEAGDSLGHAYRDADLIERECEQMEQWLFRVLVENAV